MDIHVQDSAFKDNNLIENYTSFIWTDRYSALGDFNLVLPITSANRKILEGAEYFAIASSDRTMVVETIEEKDGNFTVTGRSLEALLERRVVETYGPYPSTSLTNFIINLVNYNAGGLAAISERQIPFFSTVTTVPSGFSDPATYDAVKYGEGLYTGIKTLCDGVDLGFRILNPRPGLTMEFSFYYGVDLTFHGSDMVVFSESAGNIQNVSQLKSDVPLKNVAVVNLPPGDGSVGLGEIWRVNSGSVPSGLDRREVWTDASDLRKDSTFTAINKPSRANLWGVKELTAHPSVNNIDFELTKSNKYVYMENYNLGDIVPVIDSSGEMVKYRVTEYIQSAGPEGKAAYPTLTIV